MDVNRRKFLLTGGIAAASAAFVAACGSPAPVGAPPARNKPPAQPSLPSVPMYDSEWRQRLSPAQFHTLREGGTEPAFSSPLVDEHRPGTYSCAGCGQALFSSTTKFEPPGGPGHGWPGFTAPIEPAAVLPKPGTPPVEVNCGRCRSHLGHLFDDGPTPTHQHYCIDGVAMQFRPS